MTDTTSLEPLADYLEPKFGNIYEYGLIAVDGLEVQPWTDELKQAIGRFLLDDGPKELVKQAFNRDDNESDDEWLDGIFASCEPWEVAFALRLAIVRSMSTLDALIGHLQTWPSEEERWDANHWLEEHVTESQLTQIARLTWHEKLTRQPYRANLSFKLTHILEPPALLKAWNDIAGSAPSDLTDAEWGVIEPFVPAGVARNNARSAINGMLYWSASGKSLSQMPVRYGTWQAIYQRHRNYKRKGVFARMLQALQDKPEAARFVEWLRQYGQ